MTSLSIGDNEKTYDCIKNKYIESVERSLKARKNLLSFLLPLHRIEQDLELSIKEKTRKIDRIRNMRKKIIEAMSGLDDIMKNAQKVLTKEEFSILKSKIPKNIRQFMNFEDIR